MMKFFQRIVIYCISIILVLTIPAKLDNEILETSTFQYAQNTMELNIINAINNEDTVVCISCKWGGFNITQQEYELICRTTYCEAGNQDSETQKMVALTILNRFCSDLFKGDIKEIIYHKNAYEVTQWSNFEELAYTEQVQEAVNCALSDNPHPRDMFYFRSEHYHSFGEEYKQSGNLYFSTEN